MKSLTLGLIGALALAGTVFAQVPSTNGTSDGNANTGMGSAALGGPASSNGGVGNTASGAWALNSNTTGSYNTASGAYALEVNTTGSYNDASGMYVLTNNTTGSYNDASGYAALYYNTTGSYNAASGYGALYSSTTGYFNAASGAYALFSNTTGNNNTASGSYALAFNTNGGSNAAFGYAALYNNTGGNNTAVGQNALKQNTTGNNNTAVGRGALVSATTGQHNTALGLGAGYYVTTGSNNIEIGNIGTAGDNGLIRVGTQGTQTATYIAGINGSHVTGSAVYVTSTGQLGVLASSERYKTAVESMGLTTERLKELRPVTFSLKSDPKVGRQYGLIAEEVAKVYPELVIRNGAGQAEGVRYEELTPMLLNEVQKQQTKLQSVEEQVVQLKRVNEAMQAAISELRAKDQLVAQR
jgi:hypothetical protein